MEPLAFSTGPNYRSQPPVVLVVDALCSGIANPGGASPLRRQDHREVSPLRQPVLGGRTPEQAAMMG